MSSLSKMAKTLNQKKDINTEQYLSQIYDSLIKEVHSRSLKNEDMNALRIQTFLRQIKYIQQNNLASNNSLNLSNVSADFPFASFWSKASQISLMQALYDSHKELFQYNLFNLTSNESHILGSYLESGMRQVLNTLESAVTNTDYYEVKNKNSNIKVGGQHIQVPDLLNITDNIMKSEFNNVYVKTQEELKKYNKDNGQIATYMPSVQGKIDINGYEANLSIGGVTNLSEYTKSILRALKGATFTAKNYISTSELKFGQTNPFRIFATVAPGGHESVGRFYRMIGCFESHDAYHSNAPVLFYRIKAIYELTGIGAKYVDSAMSNIIKGNGSAKYLVWNNPLGNIYVIPTQKIISELIEKAAEESLPKDWKDALYGKVVLPQINLAELAN